MRLGSLFCLLIALVGVCAAQDSNFSVGPQYLITGSPIFARPVATPTLSLNTPLPPIPDLPQIGPVIGTQPYIADPVLEHQADLFPIYYGYAMPSVVEIVGAEPPRELPASIIDPGVAGITTAQSLNESGYGVPLGETASYWKAHKPRAPRVYTNADVERLHGG
ncbi:MAG TPA: hypothetical protein VH350_16990 [Candidatus Sulfotelmatobacter sp.]|nr:hypothetical protein [Candidatus Sulfotelmatobacter sp.]